MEKKGKSIIDKPIQDECGCSHGPDNIKLKGVLNQLGLHKSGCLYCGAEIVYPEEQIEATCYFCKDKKTANSKCKNGHFICDKCHSGDLCSMVEKICIASDETEMMPLFDKIKDHSLVPLHGPEHHFIVPGVITSVYRNLGGDISDNDIIAAIRRGKEVPGGACGFWGVCGAAIASGIAFSTIVSSSPLIPEKRSVVQQAVSEIAGSISEVQSARCCRRESLTALIKVEEISDKILPVKLKAGISSKCEQFRQNKECPGKKCLFFPEKATLSPFMELPKDF